MLNGQHFEYGSQKESIAIQAQHKLDLLRYYELQSIISTIAQVASAANSPGGEIKFDQTNKVITQYKEILFPELTIDRESKADRVKRIMQDNIGKVLKVKLPDLGSKGLVKRNK